MRRFYAPPVRFSTNSVSLDEDETRHLRDVLRLRPGAEVRVFDGAGREFSCIVENIAKRETVLRVKSEIAAPAPEADLNLTLAVALLKGEKFDLIVQKATELGVLRLVPLATKRADVKIKDVRDSAKRLERWRKIVLEASKQSGRAMLMTIEAPQPFDEFIETETAAAKILFAERGGAGFSAIEAKGAIIALIGAEGGWEESEIEAARERGFQIITFGGRILRAETAAITIAGILQHRFGDLA